MKIGHLMCDRCGITDKFKDTVILDIKISGLADWDNDSLHKDLCEQCRETLRTWMTKKKVAK